VKRLVFTGVAVLGAALLVVAEFSPLYEVVVGSLEIVRRRVDGGESHDYCPARRRAWRCRWRSAPHAARGRPRRRSSCSGARRSSWRWRSTDRSPQGRLAESLTYEDAHARPARGLYLEIVGAGMLVVAGVAGARRRSARRSRSQTQTSVVLRRSVDPRPAATIDACAQSS